MKPKIFLFDIGNVLMDFDLQILLDRLARDSGQPLRALSAQDVEMYCAAETGRISDQEYIDYLNAAYGLNWSIADYIQIWEEMFSVNPVGRSLFLGALERELPVYTLSNIAQHHMDAIEQVEPGFFQGATGLFLSYQMGVRKPHPDIYKQALAQLGVDGEQCLFIDDMPENVAAARAAGIQAYQFVPETYDQVKETVDSFFAQV